MVSLSCCYSKSGSKLLCDAIRQNHSEASWYEHVTGFTERGISLVPASSFNGINKKMLM